MLCANKGIVLSLLFISSVFTVDKHGPIFGFRGSHKGRSGDSSSSSGKDDYGKRVGLGKISIGTIIEYNLKLSLENRIRKDWEFKQCSSSLTESQYVNKTREAIKKHYTTITQKSDSVLDDVLKMIYRNLSNTSKASLAVFTTHAIFNTSVFSNLEEKGNETYRSRGLLALRGKENYALLDSYSSFFGINEKFVDNPSKLATLSANAIISTIKWWERTLKHATTDFFDSLKILKPVEFVNFQKKQNNAEEAKRLTSRKNLYETIVAVYQ